jgi:hypothetical protein
LYRLDGGTMVLCFMVLWSWVYVER